MERKPDRPCSRCGRMLWTGATSLPTGKIVCRSCRREEPAPYKLTYADPYGPQHKRIRAELLPRAVYTVCPICKKTMWPTERLALDHAIPLHVDPTPRPGDRIVHSRCNSSWRSGNDTPPMTAEERRVRKRDQWRQYSAARPTTAGRGYGYEHQQERKRWKPLVDRGEVSCGRCHRIIAPGTPWHLDHDDQDRSVYLGPAHRKCNIKAANSRRAGRAGRPA